MLQICWSPGLRPGPRWGAYNAPAEPLAGGEGARCPLPKNSTPAFGPTGLKTSALRASGFGPTDLALPSPTF